MLRGFYTAANGIFTENRILNVRSNNIANLKTAGYKSDDPIPTTFAENLLLINGRKSETGTIRYRTLDETYTSLEQGTMEETGSSLDAAIIGSVYFNVERYSDGERLLTKDGQFDISGDGYLELGNCGRVLDANGDYIQLTSSDFYIDENGVINTDDGRQITLGLTYLDEADDVEKIGDNLFRPYNGYGIGDIPAGTKYSVRQGWYERSNVDLADEMTKILDANNVFNANAQALQIINSVNQIACNDLIKK